MNEESIFAAALDKRPGDERQEFLAAACGDDAGLRRRVERLLDADANTTGILEHGPDAAQFISAPSADRQFAGRYQLRQKIGEGGMGEVWVADQAEPVRRRVALKMIRAGFDSSPTLARFEAERQALALMDHPNIAKVLDAGVADGRPYFVMELLHGVPITRYCDDARLSPRERVALFVPVCQAVQHAHQKGVIHRDLKPSNILVAEYDGKPVPKVIDFGVAKAVGPRLADRSVYTEVGSLIGTLEYMSPEQAGLSNLDIDTRSDIYSLGAVLYELLTGTVPFPRRDHADAPITELLRVIREVDPPKPSTRLSDSATLADVAAGRRTEPDKLVALVRGELDWVVLKCLEKDRGRRYQTASGLAQDLERYLKDEPVEASPPSAAYRLRKFARRNRGLLTAAAAFAVLLVAAAGVSGWQALRATAARDAEAEQRQKADRARAEALAVLVYFQDKVLAAARPKDRDGGLGREATIRQAVDRAEPEVAQAFADQPLAEASIRHTIGVSYYDLGDLPAARRQAERALALRRQLLGPEHADTLATASSLALIAHEQGALDEARALQEETLRVRRQTIGPDHRDTLATMYNLASTLYEARRFPEAHALAEEALERQRRVLGPNDRATLNTMNCFANALMGEGGKDKVKAAVALAEDALRVRRDTLGSNHPDTLFSMNTTGSLLSNAGRPDDARKLFEEALPAMRSVLGPDHLYTLRTAYNLARQWGVMGRYKDAEPLFRETLAHQQKVLGPDHPKTLLTMTGLGVTLDMQGKLDEAQAVYADTLRLTRNVRKLDHPETLTAIYNLANVEYERGRLAESREMFEEAVPLMRSALGPSHSTTLRGIDGLASVLALAGDPAVRDPRRAVELAKEVVGRTPKAADKWATLAVAEYAAGNWSGAIAALDKADSLLAGKSDPGNRFFRALAHWHLGATDAARAAAGTTAEATAATFAVPGKSPEWANDPQNRLRYDAACLAVACAAAPKADAPAYRKLALDLMTAELAAVRKLATTKPAVAHEALRQWLADEHVAAVRDPSASASLPPEERAAWAKLWAEAADLRDHR